jgi:AcrR family transcriptional regulator
MSKESGGYSDKQDQIVSAAQKRFGLYGVEKTTMQEIAMDLGMTKGSIYYYFPDKEHLYLEVVKREFNVFETAISSRLRDLSDPEMMLVEYVRVRASLFQSFLNLSRFKIEGVPGLKSFMQAFWNESLAKEREIISMIFSFGIEKKMLIMDDPVSMSLLFLDLLKGLRMISLRDKQLFYMEQPELEILVEKSVKFARIFFKGLKA